MYLPQWVDSTVNGVTAGENGEWIYGSRSTDRGRLLKIELSQDRLADNANQTAYVAALRQEINRPVRLLGIFHTFPSSLQLAVKGEVLISEQLEA